MKDRILTGWNLQRVAFLGIGIFTLITSAQDHAWVGVLFGTYFAAMGLFAFGCAAGNCAVVPRNPVSYNEEEVSFEEIKSK